MTIGDYVDRIEIINKCQKLTWLLNGYFNNNKSSVESFKQYLEDTNNNKYDFNISDLIIATNLLIKYGEMLKKIEVKE